MLPLGPISISKCQDRRPKYIILCGYQTVFWWRGPLNVLFCFFCFFYHSHKKRSEVCKIQTTVIISQFHKNHLKQTLPGELDPLKTNLN